MLELILRELVELNAPPLATNKFAGKWKLVILEPTLNAEALAAVVALEDLKAGAAKTGGEGLDLGTLVADHLVLLHFAGVHVGRHGHGTGVAGGEATDRLAARSSRRGCWHRAEAGS